MIKAFSQKLMPPFSGQVQIAESDTYRALTLDGLIWEIQYVKRSHIRVGTLTANEIKTGTFSSEKLVEDAADPKLMVLLDYLRNISLPFPATDHFEYWVLDRQDNRPLALIFACSEAEQKAKFPSKVEWTALPDAVMSIEKSDTEVAAGTPPVNYRLERLVAERAGTKYTTAWFDRREHDPDTFPPFLITEDWNEASQAELCQRYIDRQAPRLLMLHDLTTAQRQRLESSCSPYATEVNRFCGLYPEIVDEELIKALRVEARLREVSGSGGHSNVQNRRDGILYI